MIPKPSRRQLALAAAAILLFGAVAAAVTLSAPVSGEVTLSASDGPAVTLVGDTDADLRTPIESANTVNWTTAAGNATFSSDSDTSLRIQTSDLEGTWTNATQIDASSADLTINPADKEAVTVGGNVTDVAYRGDLSLDDDVVAVAYSASGNGTITLRGLEADREFTAATTDGEVVDSGTTSGSGTVTLSVDSATDEQVVLFSNSAPQIDNSSATPSDGEELTNEETTLSVNVSDATFGTAQGDEVTATFRVDGEVVGTDTRSSNGTVSTTAVIGGGNQTWSVTVEDSYGATITSATFEFKSPTTLDIRAVEDPDSLIGANGTITVTFFASDGTSVIEKKSDNGAIDLSDPEFNASKKFIVSADVDGYHDRTIILDSLYEQSAIYLLNESTSSVSVEFLLDDATGRFSGSSNTELIIQRSLTVNNSTSWRTVIGDEISASREAPTTLEQDSRYRLIVRNDEEQRVLGQYVATSDEPNEVLPIGEVDIEGEIYSGVAMGATLQEDSETTALRYIFRDLNGSAEMLSVEFRNESNGEVIYTANTTDPPSTVVDTVPLKNISMDEQYVLKWSAEMADSDTRSNEIYLGSVPEVGCLGLASGVCQMGGYLAILMTFGLVAIKDPAGGVIGASIVASGLAIAGVVPVGGIQLGLAFGLGIVMHVGGVGR